MGYDCEPAICFIWSLFKLIERLADRFHFFIFQLRYLSVEFRMERHVPEQQSTAEIEDMEVLKAMKIHFAFGFERM